jgi:hypothetical protein
MPVAIYATPLSPFYRQFSRYASPPSRTLRHAIFARWPVLRFRWIIAASPPQVSQKRFRDEGYAADTSPADGH